MKKIGKKVAPIAGQLASTAIKASGVPGASVAGNMLDAGLGRGLDGQDRQPLTESFMYGQDRQKSLVGSFGQDRQKYLVSSFGQDRQKSLTASFAGKDRQGLTEIFLLLARTVRNL